jgi:hypothetical protein
MKIKQYVGEEKFLLSEELVKHQRPIYSTVEPVLYISEACKWILSVVF